MQKTTRERIRRRASLTTWKLVKLHLQCQAVLSDAKQHDVVACRVKRVYGQHVGGLLGFGDKIGVRG